MARTTTVNWATSISLDIEVTAEVSGGSPGRTYGPPEECYPAESPDVEIVKIEVGGKDVTALLLDLIDSGELACLQTEAEEKAEQAEEDAEADAAEMRAEMAREARWDR